MQAEQQDLPVAVELEQLGADRPVARQVKGPLGGLLDGGLLIRLGSPGEVGDRNGRVAWWIDDLPRPGVGCEDAAAQRFLSGEQRKIRLLERGSVERAG